MRACGLVLAVVAWVLAGCGGTTTLGDVTLWRRGLMTGAPAALTSGQLAFIPGCLGIAPNDPPFERLIVVWPPDARLEHTGNEIVLVVNGLTLHHGDEISIGGGSYDAEQIEAVVGPIPPECRGDRYWLASETKRELP